MPVTLYSSASHYGSTQKGTRLFHAIRSYECESGSDICLFSSLISHNLALQLEAAAEPVTQPTDQPVGEAEDCVICLSSPQDTVLNPCGHVCVCGPCSKTLRHHQSPTCPMCHAPVKGAKPLRTAQHQQVSSV